MAYQLNSAKDSQGNEDQFVADFTRNQAAIVAYKQQHGGDLEGAYQAVTGKPWPAGRSVKINNGKPEMTKDRTVKSVLGKYVAPIAAGIIAPYAIGALAGGGAAAGGAAAGSSALPIGIGVGETAAHVGLGGALTTGGAAAGGGSLLHSLLPAIIGGAATVGGTAIAAHANSEAAKKQAEQADKAMKVQQEQYALQRQDTAPYRSLGQGAVGNLGYLAGIDVDSKVPELSATVPKVPYGQQAPSLSTLGQPAQGGMVPMKNPQTGTVHLVPQADVSTMQQHGGVVVS